MMSRMFMFAFIYAPLVESYDQNIFDIFVFIIQIKKVNNITFHSLVTRH